MTGNQPGHDDLLPRPALLAERAAYRYYRTYVLFCQEVVDGEYFGELGGGEAGFGEDGLQDGRFAGDVGVDVHGGVGGEGEFGGAVLVAQVGSPAEEVADGEMVADAEAATLTDVDVAFGVVVRGEEGFTARNTLDDATVVRQRFGRRKGSHRMNFGLNVSTSAGI